MPWIDLPVTIVLLGGYLGVAYITHATQGIYSNFMSLCVFLLSILPLIPAYSFLDPKKQGKLLAAYIIGIAVGQVIIFVIIRWVIMLREKIAKRQKGVHTGAGHESEKLFSGGV